MKSTSLAFAGFVTVVLAGGISAQDSTSAMEFFDASGAQTTAKIGWSGSADNGHVFIETPSDGEGVKVKQGVITAQGFVGDGSGLTNLPQQSVAVNDVDGLQSALDAKADTIHSHTEAQIPNGTYMINSQGNSGQVWQSDGAGRGVWGSVTNANIANTSLISGSKIADSTIPDSKIMGISASKITGSLPVVSGGGFKNMTPPNGIQIPASWSSDYSITLNIPSPGFVIVFASGSSGYYNAQNDSIGEIVTRYEVTHGSPSALASDAAGYSVGLKKWMDKYYFSINKGFSVSPGPNTFYLTFRCEPSARANKSVVNEPMLSAIFFPTRL